MASAKDILVKPIKAAAANALVKRVHYSGKVVSNSNLHFGVFLNGSLEGAMSFGSPIDKRKVVPLVRDTSWNGMLELNRMAFSDRLPRNSESRAMSIAFKMIKKNYPHIEWILSFSDGCQCGDGTIYRASGFILTAIKKNSRLFKLSDGSVYHKLNFEQTRPTEVQRKLRKKHNMPNSSVSALLKKEGVEVIEGYQLRYIYFLNPEARKRLTVPVLPFSKIQEMGAGMYKGQKRVKEQESENPSDLGGATPTNTLQQ